MSRTPDRRLSRRAFVAASSALGAALIARPSVAAAGEIGVTVATRGVSTLQRNDGILALEPNAALYEGDLVKTSLDSFAELALNTATRINLGPRSEVAIDRYVADIGGLITIGGAIAFDRPDDLPPLDLTVQAAFAQIGVRGTRFFAGPSRGAFAVFVDRGSLTVTVGEATRTLGPGDGVEVIVERPEDTAIAGDFGSSTTRGLDLDPELETVDPLVPDAQLVEPSAPGVVGSLVQRARPAIDLPGVERSIPLPGDPPPTLGEVVRWGAPRIAEAFALVGLGS